MNQWPAFLARSYPSFRPARNYRVVVAPQALYFLRMRGLVGVSDAGGGVHLDPAKIVMAWLIKHLAKRSIEAGTAELDQADPEHLVFGSTRHFRAGPDEVVESSLDPPSLLGGHGPHVARWRIVLKERRPMRFQIETPADLEIARRHLPEVLGSTLRSNFA